MTRTPDPASPILLGQWIAAGLAVIFAGGACGHTPEDTTTWVQPDGLLVETAFHTDTPVFELSEASPGCPPMLDAPQLPTSVTTAPPVLVPMQHVASLATSPIIELDTTPEWLEIVTSTSCDLSAEPMAQTEQTNPTSGDAGEETELERLRRCA